MTFAEYVEESQEFACYPQAKGLEYTALGLANETFELLEKYWDDAPESEIRAELGDVLWYTGACYVESGIEIPVPETIRGWTYYTDRPGSRGSLYGDLMLHVGKYTGHVKKWLRLDPGIEARMTAMQVSLEGTLVAIHRLSQYYGSGFEQVMEANYAKLSDRAARGVLQGNGDQPQGQEWSRTHGAPPEGYEMRGWRPGSLIKHTYLEPARKVGKTEALKQEPWKGVSNYLETLTHDLCRIR